MAKSSYYTSKISINVIVLTVLRRNEADVFYLSTSQNGDIMTIKISGTSLNKFIENTSQAMVVVGGSPLKKMSTLKKFLVKQLGTENENLLERVFENGSETLLCEKEDADGITGDFHYYLTSNLHWQKSNSLHKGMLAMSKALRDEILRGYYNLSGQSVKVFIYKVEGKSEDSRYDIIDYVPQGVKYELFEKTSIEVPAYHKKGNCLIVGEPEFEDEYFYSDVLIKGCQTLNKSGYEFGGESTLIIDSSTLEDYADDMEMPKLDNKDAVVKCTEAYAKKLGIELKLIRLSPDALIQ